VVAERSETEEHLGLSHGKKEVESYWSSVMYKG
jgi:hypothetical protein